MSTINNILDQRISSVNLFNILTQVYGAKGIPFPGKPREGGHSVIGQSFNAPVIGPEKQIGRNGGTIKQYTDSVLGKYEFLPATINGVLIPNSVVLITGEKKFIEEDVIDVGTVFEKAFTKPYDITIIATLIGEDQQWPEDDFERLSTMFKENDIVTLKCASTNFFLQPEGNFLIQKIDILDSSGFENVEVIQFTGRSNVDFELEIL